MAGTGTPRNRASGLAALQIKAMPKRALPLFLQSDRGPSDYTIERNDRKDAEEKTHREQMQKNADARLILEKQGKEIAQQHLRLSERAALLRQQEFLLKQEADFFKQNMQALNTAMEREALSKLSGIDPDKIESINARIKLSHDYPIEKFSDAGKEAFKLWDQRHNFATEKEYTRLEKVAQKKSDDEEKRTNALADKALKQFTDAQTRLEDFNATKDASESKGEPLRAGILSGIASQQKAIRLYGEQLRKLKPEYEPEVSAAITGIDTYNKAHHDAADAALAEANAKGLAINAPELVRARADLNFWKRQTNAPQVVSPSTGAMIPNPDYKEPEKPVAPSAPPKVDSSIPRTDSKIAPPATSSIPDDTRPETAEPPAVPSTPAPRSMFVPGSTPAPSKSSTGASAFTQPDAKQPDDQWAEVAKKRDAAIAERNKNLDILTDNSISNPFNLPKIYDASDAASDANRKGNQYQDQLDAMSTATRQANHDKLVANLGGQEAYDAALSAVQSKAAPGADAPPSDPGNQLQVHPANQKIPPESPKLDNEDLAAISWAKSNPDDDRAQKILSYHGLE